MQGEHLQIVKFIGGILMKYDLIVSPSRKPLDGEIEISNSKHLVVPLLATSLLTKKKMLIKDIPKIKDTVVILDCLRRLNCSVKKKKNDVIIDTTCFRYTSLPKRLLSQVHGTLYLFPSILAREGKAELKKCFGGCDIGRRPILNIISPLRSLGARIHVKNNTIKGEFENASSSKISLDFANKHYNKYVSGYTKTALIGSIFRKGKTKIYNYFCRYPIPEFISCLNRMGAKIKMKKDHIEVIGVKNLRESKITLSSDQIEIFTLICLVGICKGKIKLKNAEIKNDFKYEKRIFEKVGIKIKELKNSLIVECNNELNGINIDTSYFHTDVQPLFASLMLFATSCSTITESVWENRFRYVNEFKKMGAKITKKGNKITIFPNYKIEGSAVEGSDLRTSAALILASFGGEGSNRIRNAHHIDRGYENLINKLKKLNLDINVKK